MLTVLRALLDKLPKPLQRIAAFGCIGVLGLVVDIATLRCATQLFGFNPYAGRVLSYLVAATSTWLGNRSLTFADRPQPTTAQARSKQWLLFLALNAIGFAINYGTYAVLLNYVPLVHDHLFLGVAAGSLAGMGFNFVAANWVVFGQMTDDR